MGTQPGDSVRVGNLSFLIVGRVTKTPGQAAIAATVAPTVFIPNQFLANTGLLQRGSRIAYKYYYQLAPDKATGTVDADKFIKPLTARLDKEGINYDTVTERKNQTGRSFADLTKYLSLVAFVALLLGCVGVASAVQLYVKEKVASVAILRTLGASGRQAFLIYLYQTTLMGLIGATVGAVSGVGGAVAASPRLWQLPAHHRRNDPFGPRYIGWYRHGVIDLRPVLPAAAPRHSQRVAPTYAAHLLRR